MKAKSLRSQKYGKSREQENRKTKLGQSNALKIAVPDVMQGIQKRIGKNYSARFFFVENFHRLSKKISRSIN